MELYYIQKHEMDVNCKDSYNNYLLNFIEFRDFIHNLNSEKFSAKNSKIIIHKEFG